MLLLLLFARGDSIPPSTSEQGRSSIAGAKNMSNNSNKKNANKCNNVNNDGNAKEKKKTEFTGVAQSTTTIFE